MVGPPAKAEGPERSGRPSSEETGCVPLPRFPQVPRKLHIRRFLLPPDRRRQASAVNWDADDEAPRAGGNTRLLGSARGKIRPCAGGSTPPGRTTGDGHAPDLLKLPAGEGSSTRRRRPPTGPRPRLYRPSSEEAGCVPLPRFAQGPRKLHILRLLLPP